jgi:SAM-dependent methyltransferase
MSHYSDKHYIANNDFDKFYYNLLFNKGDKILDVGCSTGNFIVQDPKNITGIDLDSDAIQIAKKRGFNAIEHDVTKKLPFKTNSFEKINCRHVLEHLRDPLPFIKELHRILRKNGKLILQTDKITKYFWDDYTHIKPYTKRALEQLAYDSGFKKCVIYNFPAKGIFGIGFLYKHKIITSKLAKNIYKLFGNLFRMQSIILEVTK